MGKNARMTYEERLIYYMRLKKSELATMLAMRDLQEDKLKKGENGSRFNYPEK